MPLRRIEFGEENDSDGYATATTSNTSPSSSSITRLDREHRLVPAADEEALVKMLKPIGTPDVDSSNRKQDIHNRNSSRRRRSRKQNNKAENGSTTGRHHKDDHYLYSHVVPPRRLLRPDNVTALLHDFYDDLTINKDSKSRECWNALYEKYHSSYKMVRPSGNPIDTQGFVDLFCCEEIVLHELKLVSVDDIQILAGGLVAIVISTVDQSFTYKHERQEDRVTLTSVLEDVDGDIKIRHEHRSTGISRKPTDRWDEDRSSSTSDSHLANAATASSERAL